MDRIHHAIATRLFVSLACIATLAALAGPSLAAGLGSLFLRAAMGQWPSTAAGTLEAGALTAITWMAFES